jgi:glycerol uptake facilitator-like aquaporin
MVVLAPIAIFDIAGPIIVQSVARNQGASLTVALAVSGAPPAGWIIIDMAWRARVDAVGVFVLSSISLATLIGLATGSGRLYLLDGAILTGVFGLVCLASLATPRPLMFHFALASNGGPESPRGREFAYRWRYAAFRRVFVVMTVVWGAGFVVQAAVNAAIIEATSTEKAFVINKILPYLFLGVLGAWTFLYGMRAKRRGEAASTRTPALFQRQDRKRVPGRSPSG